MRELKSLKNERVPIILNFYGIMHFMRTYNPALLFPLLLVFYEVGGYLSNDMYLPALPSMMVDLNTSQELAQLTLTTWFLGSASMQLIIGPLSDRFGRRPIVLVSAILYIVTSSICALTSDITPMLVARFIQGVSVSAVLVAGYASIHELYDQAHAIRVLATMNSVIVLAPAFGPLIGSILINFLDWRWLFWIIAIWALIATICLAKWMPESHPVEKRQPLNLKSIGKNYFSIVTNWRFNTLMLTFCFTFCGFIAWLTSGPFIVVNEFNETVLGFGVCQTIIFSVYIGANQLVKKLMNIFSLNKLIWFGLLTTFIGGITSMLLTLLYPTFLFGLVLGMCIYSLGSGFSFSPLNRLAVEASNEPMGARIAVTSTYMTSFGVLGSILGTVFYKGSMSSIGLVLFTTSFLAVTLKLLSMVRK